MTPVEIVEESEGSEPVTTAKIAVLSTGKPIPKEKPMKKIIILLIIISVSAAGVLTYSYIDSEILTKTEYTMQEFKDEFSYGEFAISEPIEGKFLDRDLYIIDTVSQIEDVYYLFSFTTGVNLVSTGTQTDNSSDSIEYDILFDQQITEPVSVGDKISVVATITQNSKYYHFDFSDIEIIE